MQELVRFDLQNEQHPEISGIEYQQGTRAGYELREDLLEKHNRTCAYCDKTDVPLQVEHIVPRSKGGTDRVSNLTLACEPCNRRKGNQPVEVFLKQDPERLAKVLRDAKMPLKDATAVNATRWELFRRLQATGLPVECGSGGRTKFNRTTRGLPQTHWLDAACVGAGTPGAPGRRRRSTAADQGVRPRQAEPLRDGQAGIPDPARPAVVDVPRFSDRRHRACGHTERETPRDAHRPHRHPAPPVVPHGSDRRPPGPSHRR